MEDKPKFLERNKGKERIVELDAFIEAYQKAEERNFKLKELKREFYYLTDPTFYRYVKQAEAEISRRNSLQQKELFSQETSHKISFKASQETIEPVQTMEVQDFKQACHTETESQDKQQDEKILIEKIHKRLLEFQKIYASNQAMLDWIDKHLIYLKKLSLPTVDDIEQTRLYYKDIFKKIRKDLESMQFNQDSIARTQQDISKEHYINDSIKETNSSAPNF